MSIKRKPLCLVLQRNLCNYNEFKRHVKVHRLLSRKLIRVKAVTHHGRIIRYKINYMWLLKALLGDFSCVRFVPASSNKSDELIPVCVMSLTVCETLMIKAEKVVRFLRVVSTNLKFKYTLYVSGTLCAIMRLLFVDDNYNLLTSHSVVK